MKNIRIFYLKIFFVFVVKISVYLNRRVFIMHTLISAQSVNSIVFRLQPVYFFVYFIIKAYFVGTHLNLLIEFKWCYDLSLICLVRLHIACRYIFNLCQLGQRVDSLAQWLEHWIFIGTDQL